MAFRMIDYTFVLLISLVVFKRSCAAPAEDLIEQLPLWTGPTPTPQYSGYLDATAGCDLVNGGLCQLHYWLALAEGDDWKEKPLVLWLNGGPGASSVLGFFTELGPLLITENDKLVENPYSWTKVANVFVLESPAGVGYSYCGRSVHNSDPADPYCRNTDRGTATAARAALVDFFDHKFPEFQTSEFFITGESYAGVYVPLLAYEILFFNKYHASRQLPLTGIAVGDPCTDNVAQAESRDPLWYANKHGLVDEAVYSMLTSAQCNATAILSTMMDITGNDEDELSNQMSSPSNMFEDPECQLAWKKFLLSSSNGIAGKWDHRYIDRYSLYSSVSTAVEEAAERYMNRYDVKKALHVDKVTLPDEWKKHAIPSNFHYLKQYSACNHNAQTGVPSMVDFHRKMAGLLDRIWIFNGDADPCVSYEGTRTAVKRIGLAEVSSYRPWFYHQGAAEVEFLRQAPVTFGANLALVDAGIQLGGEVVDYENNVTFLTIHGAGHMVPMIRPRAALHMLKKFLKGEPLAPDLPSNKTLVAMTESDFVSFMDTWTNEAKSPPYVN